MSYRTNRRRRQIATKGRQMVLSRASGTASVTLMAYASPAQSAQITNDMAQAPFVAQVMSDALSGYGMPAQDDRVQDGPKTYTLTDAQPVYDGPTVCGWTLIAAGGETHDNASSLL